MFGKKEVITVNVEGMMCNKCASHVSEAVKAVSGVKKVDVSLDEKKVTVTVKEGTASQSIINAINEAGYKASL